MKVPFLRSASIYITLFLILFSIPVFPQEVNDKNCCAVNEKETKNSIHNELKDTKFNSTVSDDDEIINDNTVNIKVVKLEAWNEVCPVKGKIVDPQSHLVDYKAKVYGFCCNGCDSRFIKDPENYTKNLSEDGKRYVDTK